MAFAPTSADALIESGYNPGVLICRAFALWSAISCAAVGCASSGLDGHTYHGDGFAFRIEAPEGGWERLEATDAALAFAHPKTQAAMMVNARCGLDGEDVPLAALTQHLFLQFTEREISLQEVVPFDGREAQHTRLRAKLDGVPMRYDVWVLKKNGCVFDLLYLAPAEGFDAAHPAFERLVRGFKTVEDVD